MITGYRTLCIAEADISADFYEKWREDFYEASVAIHKRNEKLANVAELIEKVVFWKLNSISYNSKIF